MIEKSAAGFGLRLRNAAADHPEAPDEPSACVLWLQGRLLWRFQSAVQADQIEAWYLGQAVPSDEVIKKFAQLLTVDYFWLRSGGL